MTSRMRLPQAVMILVVCALPALTRAAVAGGEDARVDDTVTRPDEGAAILDLSRDWRHRACSAGECARWSASGFVDAEWERGTVFSSTVSGVRVRELWYRKRVDTGAPWPRAFLALSGVRGRVDVFIDGNLVVGNLTRPHQGTRQIVREITRAVASSTSYLLALRVSSEDAKVTPGFEPDAGIPVLLARDARGLFASPAGWFDYLAQEHPDLPWPSWARSDGEAWVPVGSPRGGGPVLVMGRQGQLEPVGRDFAVSTWLHYPAGGRLYCLETLAGEFGLEGKFLPLPWISAKAGRWFNLFLRCWADEPPKQGGFPVGIGEVTIENTLDRTREVELIVVVHPFGPRFPPHAIKRIEYDPGTNVVLVNSRPALVLQGTPDVFFAVPFSDSGGTIARSLTDGKFPSALIAEDERFGLASGAAVYRFGIQPFGSRTHTFRILTAGAPDRVDPELAGRVNGINWKESRRAAEGAWRKALTSRGRMMLRIPDKPAQEAFYACLGYLLMAASRDGSGGESSLADSALSFAGLGGSLAPPGISETGGVPVEADDAPAGEAPAGRGGEEWCSEGLCRPGVALERARVLLAGGETEEALRIMEWCLDRQVPPLSYAWPEAVDAETGKCVAGSALDLDAAAHYVCLMREMLLAEREDRLEICPGLPTSWLKPGTIVQLHYAPTRFGIIPGFSIVSSPRELSLRIYSLEQVAKVERMRTPAPIEAARPPAGYLWRIPGTNPVSRVLVDDRVREAPSDRRLELDAGTSTVKVAW